VEKAIGEDLEAQVVEPAALQTGKQMVPLEHLVKQNAVEEAADGKPECVSGPAIAQRECAGIRLDGIRHGCSFSPAGFPKPLRGRDHSTLSGTGLFLRYAEAAPRLFDPRL